MKTNLCKPAPVVYKPRGCSWRNCDSSSRMIQTPSSRLLECTWRAWKRLKRNMLLPRLQSKHEKDPSQQRSHVFWTHFHDLPREKKWEGRSCSDIVCSRNCWSTGGLLPPDARHLAWHWIAGKSLHRYSWTWKRGARKINKEKSKPSFCSETGSPVQSDDWCFL